MEIVDGSYEKNVALTLGMITNVILTDRCGLSPLGLVTNVILTDRCELSPVPPNGGTQAVGLVALVTWNDGTRGARSLRDMTLSG